MVFSDTTTKDGLIQACEQKLFGDDGYGQISDNKNRLLQFTNRINRGQDKFNTLAMMADGRWQWDDSTYTDFNIATRSIVSDQRDYSFALDHLEIEKVLILVNGEWRLIDPFDQDDIDAKTYLENNSSNTGVPTKYDKRGNSIIFDVTPNFSTDAALKVYFKRGPYYFVSTDTTRKPGFISTFHSYLSDHASTNYAIDNGFSNAKNMFELLTIKEGEIQAYYGSRNRDERAKITTLVENTR